MTCQLKIYNTLTKKVETFHSLIPGEARIYTCGPTVYDFAHIGNFRSYIFSDLLRTALEFSNHRVIQVMNITDVDDKTIRRSNEEKVSLKEFTQRYTKAFFEDLEKLKITKPEYTPFATEHISDMINLIKILEEKGFTYRSEGSVYFSIDKFNSYGKLSGMNLKKNIDGVRVDSDEYEKSSAKDFVLWKAKKENEPYWESIFGPGRPGWHIECSAMSIKYLGESFDIHTGGTDLIFPHHENEIAQSESATGKKFVSYWVHCAYLIVENEKMSKSKGNFYTLRDILAMKYSPEVVRFLLLSTHYRKNLNFTFEGLKQATLSVEKIKLFHKSITEAPVIESEDSQTEKITEEYETRFKEAICDDLNISEALSYIFELIKEFNKRYYEKPVPERLKNKILSVFETFNRVLKLSWDLPDLEEEEKKEVEKLIELRQEAKRKKDFATADSIRNELLKKGIILEDTKEGVRWKRIER